MSRRATRQRRAIGPVATLVAAAWLGGCESTPPAPPSVSIVALLRQPAERALVDGLRYYDEGNLDRAEQSFNAALKYGLHDGRDAAVAHKNLAFIACAFNRIAECEGHFRAAFAADPGFRLSDAEVGHPIWGPVYRRVAAAQGGAH